LWCRIRPSRDGRMPCREPEPPAKGTGDGSSMTCATSRGEGQHRCRAGFITPFPWPFKSQPDALRVVRERCQRSDAAIAALPFPGESPTAGCRRGPMNRHARRAAAKAAKGSDKGNDKGGQAQGAPPPLALLHAAVLQETLAGRYLEALSRCRQAL